MSSKLIFAVWGLNRANPIGFRYDVMEDTRRVLEEELRLKLEVDVVKEMRMGSEVRARL